MPKDATQLQVEIILMHKDTTQLQVEIILMHKDTTQLQVDIILMHKEEIQRLLITLLQPLVMELSLIKRTLWSWVSIMKKTEKEHYL